LGCCCAAGSCRSTTFGRCWPTTLITTVSYSTPRLPAILGHPLGVESVELPGEPSARLGPNSPVEHSHPGASC
jgi:hypothetical protein